MAKVRLTDITGFRGEKIVELCLTTPYTDVLFRPAFLGDKWPTVDFYVELLGVPDRRPFFFVQANATTKPFGPRSRGLPVSVGTRDVDRLLQLPGPTYIFGVHEPSHRVFARSVHARASARSFGSIPLAHELTGAGLRALYDEVRAYWRPIPRKPIRSVFP